MTNPLTDLRQTIREHWAAYHPRMYAELEASGELDGTVAIAAQLTEEAVTELMDRGVPLYDAWVQIREEWAILPAEEGYDEEEQEGGPDLTWLFDAGIEWEEDIDEL